MLTAIRPVIALLLSYGLLISANGMFNSLLGLRSKIEGFSTGTTGIILAGTFVGMLIGGIFGPRLVARVGHIRSFAALASIMSVAVLSHVLKIDAIVWFLLRVVAGFCLSGMTLVVESWLNDKASNKSRGQIMSLYMMTNYLGYALGQFLLLLDNPKETELFIIASIVLSLALVPILMTRAAAPAPPEIQKRLPFRQILAISPLGAIGVICAGLINTAVNSMSAVFGREIGLELSQISILVASFVFGGMLLQYPVGRLSDKLDRRTVILGITVCTSAAAILVTQALHLNVIYLFAAAIIYGGFAYTMYPLSSAQLNDLVDPSQRVQIAAGTMIFYGIGAIVGPILSAQIMGLVGPSGLFYYVSVLAGLMAVFTLVRMVKRAPSTSTKKRKSIFLPISGIGVANKQLYYEAVDSVMAEKRNQNRDDTA